VCTFDLLGGIGSKMGKNCPIGSIAFLGIAALFYSFVGCGDKIEPSDERIPQSLKIKAVKVSPIKASSPMGSMESVGVLTAQRKVNVASEMSGTIERLYFEKGDRVREGQLLAEISTSRVRLEVKHAEAVVEAARSNLEKAEKGSRPEEIVIAEAVLQEARAALVEALRNLERAEKLYEFRAVSRSEYDSAKRIADMASAKVESARQRLILARQGPRLEDRKAARAHMEQAEAALALARDRLRKSMLHAPCDGIIAYREVEEGEVIVVPPGKTITTVVDLSHLRIRISLNEKDIYILEKHKRFAFTLDAIPRETFWCRLFFVSPAADPATRSFPLEFTVEIPDERMADGMTVRIKLPLEEDKKTIKVPSAWLSEENGKIGLFVARDGKALFRNVTLGSYYDQRVEVLSGLSEQDLVIISPAGLRSGDVIKY
jgi:HlyD family secretion protein